MARAISRKWKSPTKNKSKRGTELVTSNKLPKSAQICREGTMSHASFKGCVNSPGKISYVGSRKPGRPPEVESLSEASRDGSTVSAARGGEAAGERPPRRKQHLGGESGSGSPLQRTRDLSLRGRERERAGKFFARRMRNFSTWAAFVYN